MSSMLLRDKAELSTVSEVDLNNSPLHLFTSFIFPQLSFLNLRSEKFEFWIFKIEKGEIIVFFFK